MSIRAAIVDAMLAESTISDIVDDRIYDDFYAFEDFLNQAPNSFKFPAIAVETTADEQGQKLKGHNQLNNATVTVICYQQVHEGKMRSRTKSVRDKQKAVLRVVDTLASNIKAFLNPLEGATISGLKIRYSHINSIVDSLFDTDDNRRIITRELNYSVMYS